EASRLGALRARRPAPHAGAVGGPLAGALRAALPAEWSPTQLETYARCPFRLFLQLGARLPDPATGDLDQEPRDEGSLLHAALERFVEARLARRAWPPAGDAADVAEAHAVAESVFARFEAEGRTGDPAVWSARREAVLARLARVVLAEARDHDGLVPALLEHRFGGRSERPPLEVRAGAETVLLQGRIDRVDASGDRLLVVDYKNARHATAYAELLDPEAMGVTSFQVPAYLAAAARDLPGREHLEAAYALLRKAARTEPFATDAADPVLSLSAPEGAERAGTEGAGGAGPRGFAAGVVEVVRRIRAGEFPIAPRTCEGCPYGAVCRAEGSAGEPDDAGGGS
ncbi:PD-(D/E)XK nuclease family protein, partial [Anaeromyxobacter soli]|uniref:PD-(D/E)XK nuclease family protein n=4 Tax=Anaeromyxobacter TaxID=161492 RepID=UPI001FAFB2B4